jgi:predicted O-methyltransferase YrrM
MKAFHLRSLIELVANPTLLRFYRIKNLTRGYLPASTYKMIYECARRAGEGVMIDIGPAQGGSTLALGLGIRDSGKSASTVFSIEKGLGSTALKMRDDPDANRDVLHANVAQYGLKSVCEILIGGVEEVHHRVDDTRPVSLLFIDADGALDRDFALFYNRLSAGAPIIVDDVIDKINQHAKNYLNWNSQKQMDAYVASKGAERFSDLCPLGKEYTTFQFISYFRERNLFEGEKIVGGTLFARKTASGLFDHERDGAALRHIRDKILNRYYELNPTLSPTSLGGAPQRA